MKSIKDVLKEINKGRSDLDSFKIASEQPDGYFDQKVISTGSPYLDHCINSHTGIGGIPLGNLTLITGWESSGKSSFALNVIARAQESSDKYFVYFDGENSVKTSYLDRFGVNKDRFIHNKEKNLEAVLSAAEAFSRADDVQGIIFDSVKSFVSTDVESKTAEESSIGVEARKWGSRMPIILGNAARRNISIIAINQWREKIGVSHGDPRTLPGGHWQKYDSALTVDLSKSDLIKDSRSNIIGNVLNIRIKKSKQDAYDPKEVITLNFYYDGGFNFIDENVLLLIEKGVLEQTGAWVKLPNGEKLNGKAKVTEFFKDNPDYLKSLI